MTYITAQKANSVLLIILGRALAGFGAGENESLRDPVGDKPSVPTY